MSAAPNYFLFDQYPPPVAAKAPDLLVKWESRWSAFVSSIGPALRPHPARVAAPGWLVDWEPRWRNFRESVPVALSRSNWRLEGECESGLRPGGCTFLSFLLHVAAIVFFAVIPARIVRSHALLHDTSRQYQVIYYSGEDLPQMMDAGGAQAGQSGRSGGRELFNPTQIIRIARGNKLVDIVVDAPSLKLPITNALLANLLSLPAGTPGAVPATSVHSNHAPLVLPVDAVPPRPQVDETQLRNTPQLPVGVAEPAPEAARQIAGLKLPELGASNLAPPPISAPMRDSTAFSKLSLPVPVAVEPPPQAWRNVSSLGVVGLGDAKDVIPPAVQAVGSTLSTTALGALGGTANDIAPPAPQVGPGGAGVSNSASKTLMSLVAALAGGAGAGGTGTAVVISASPGGAMGTNEKGGSGSLAMSPNGGRELGYGGSGGGTGIGVGAGPGSGTSGAGTGSATAGQGLGMGAVRPGTSPGPGPGGSGSGRGVPGGVSGITVVGGNSKVNLPGFGTPGNSTGFPERGSTPPRRKGPLTIIASARSGGALNAYDTFKGAKVYTIYIETRLGIAVLQYAQRAATGGDFTEDLSAPEPMSTNLPADLPRSRLLISCILDGSGMLKNFRILEAHRPESVPAITQALKDWRFQPALQGEQPVEVDAILGFDIDTR